MTCNATGAATAKTPTIYVIGDSTASVYASDLYPCMGWAQPLQDYFAAACATIQDKALSGRSSKSFFDEGDWTPIRAALRGGDFVLIQFGHNDEKADDPSRYTIPETTYKAYLSQYIDKARAKGANPVLITPVERRHFTSAGVIAPSHGKYPAAMIELAAAKNVPLIDLTASSTRLWNAQGVTGTKNYFMILPAGKYPNYPNGVSDNTHFQAHGAIEVARLVALHGCTLPGRDFVALHAPSIPDDPLVWPPIRPAES